MRLDVKIDTELPIVNGEIAADEETKKALSLGVRDALALLQDVHKRRVVKKTGSSKTAPQAAGKPWTSRSGGRGLLGSFHTYWKDGDLEGFYGSELPRARVHEEGATGANAIKPKEGKYLAIPTDKAPKKVWPRYVDDLFFVPLQGKKAKGALAKARGREFDVLYWLVPEVEIPARPTLMPAYERVKKDIDMIFWRALLTRLGLEE